MNSSTQSPEPHDALLEPEEHVLSTLEKDGSRRWLFPKFVKGYFWLLRRNLAYVLMAVFVLLPHLRIFGKPVLLLDIAALRFTILGFEFLPSDTPLVALLAIGTLITIVFVTALFGRVWCGWACPQTVYMEFLFRPIDRWFNKTTHSGGKPRTPMTVGQHLGRLATYLVLCLILSHSFLAYFIGTDRLAQWVQLPPWQHPIPFLVMMGTVVAMMFDFLFFREQTCLIACPYGRFQSVMLDRQSLMVAYDAKRGEPRRKGRERSEAGDCVDCHRCVDVCPTGIDIRDGLQMECINCTQCVDACDDVMTKLKKPMGLISLTSLDGLEGKAKTFFRARTIIYPAILVVIAILFFVALDRSSGFNTFIVRNQGNPFTLTGSNVQNGFKLRLTNRDSQLNSYNVEILEPTNATIEILEGTPELQPGQSIQTPIIIRFPASLTSESGRAPVVLKVFDGNRERTLKTTLLGPRR